MDFAHDVLLFVHLLGMAALFGGAFVQVNLGERVVNNAMLHGALTQVVTGLLLVAILESEAASDPDVAVDHAKVGVKFGLAVVIGLLVWVNRGESIPDGLYAGLLGLTAVTVGVAVFW
ncbi:MAG: hypothetical protein ACRDO1_09580 [Nocardioidaceae bacterium]